MVLFPLAIRLNAFLKLIKAKPLFIYSPEPMNTVIFSLLHRQTANSHHNNHGFPFLDFLVLLQAQHKTQKRCCQLVHLSS